MSYFFGDGWDLYAAETDPYVAGTYWDSGTSTRYSLAAGRFAGSRGLQKAAGVSGVWLTKASGANESVHHFCVAFQQTAAISGTTNGFYIQLLDGTTNQCAVVFRSDGVILLASGASSGATLATYTGAVTANNTWYGFEIEVVVHNTTGSFKVRKNGNTSDDFSATSLDTAGGTANNYANKVSLGVQSAALNAHLIDDFLWRSDPSSLAWVGDIRCYTRAPANDAAVQWTPSGAIVPFANFPGPTASAAALGTPARYFPFTPPCDGTIATLALQCATAATAQFKCSIFASAANAPTTVLGSANLVTNPGIGTTTFTFASPVSVTQGTQYYAGFSGSASSGTFNQASGSTGGYAPLQNATTFASFPVANPTGLAAGVSFAVTITVTPTAAANAPMVADTTQDGATTYVASSTAGQTDLYEVAAISATAPITIVGVVTRGLAMKTDAGTRSVSLDVKSGETLSSGASAVLGTSFGWLYRTDQTDPATGAAWTPGGVNAASIGITVTA